MARFIVSYRSFHSLYKQALDNGILAYGTA